MKKGDIFELRKEFEGNYPSTCYKHPFIYWTHEHADYRGIMLTTSDNPIYHNIPLSEEYFKEGWKIRFGKSDEKSISYIAPLFLLKNVKYDHLEKTGELTEAGRIFISQLINSLPYEDWVTYQTGKI